MIFSYFNYLLYINSSFTLNLKTAVSKHSKDELILNSAFSDLEDFYDTIVLPPPPRKPKGKATIENHVRFLETHLIERLKENIFTSLDSLNKETQKIIAAINQADFRNKNDIRRTREYAFQTYDKPKMKPLPSGSFTTCDYKYFLRIPDNYHLEYDGHYYSVLYTYHGKPAMLKATMSEIRFSALYHRRQSYASGTPVLQGAECT